MHEFFIKRLNKLLEKTCVENIKPANFIANSKVLIIAPHFDDEVLSCYGAIKKHIEHNAEIDIVYITDGSASKNSGLVPYDLWQLRKKEAAKSLEKFRENISVIYMDLKDGHFNIDSDEIDFLISILLKKTYSYIYCPHSSDTHNDHKEAYRLVMNTIEHINYNIIIRYYEFWNPLKKPNIYIDISDEWDGKIEAMKAHKSQLLDLNYIDLLTEIDSVRGGQVGCKYAEMFKEEVILNRRRSV